MNLQRIYMPKNMIPALRFRLLQNLALAPPIEEIKE
jgi:hypothetical protein